MILPNIKWLWSLGWLAVFLGGLSHYSGSWLIYTLFSIVFLLLLISGFVQQISYGYLFLVVMLWLGFWLKVAIHLIFQYPYVEPIGRFIGTPSLWDEVLIVATATGAGVLITRLTLMILARNKWPTIYSTTADSVPAWYLATRRWIWPLLWISLLAIASLNMAYSFYQTGIEPKLILIWPLNAAISLMLAAGFTMTIATLIWWDILLAKRITLGGYPILLEGVISTISGLSRGLIVFHAIPQLVALYQNRNRIVGYTKKKAVIMAVGIIIAIIISFTAVNLLRNLYYSDYYLAEGTVISDLSVGIVINRIGKFAIDRWIGIEGVMAVLSYPNKGFNLFKCGLLENPATGQAGLLYEDICLSNYGKKHTEKFRFGSLPGVGAFLYFTGSVTMVMLGMSIFTLIIICCEHWVSALTFNPLLSSFVGAAMANIVVQFGTAPRQIIAYCIALTLGVCIIGVVQKVK